MKIQAARRLRLVRAVNEDLEDKIEELSIPMTLLLGKGVKPEMKQEHGQQRIIFQGKSSTYDLSSSDLRRLESAISSTKAKLSIYVESGKITFEFEI
jgi:hypothetical protein